MNWIKKKVHAMYSRLIYIKNMYDYIKRYNDNNIEFGKFELKRETLKPIYYDRFKEAGVLDDHYFMQDIIVAKKIVSYGNRGHFDIGSRIDGFISHLISASVEVTLLDIRPFPYKIENLNFIQTDATQLSNIEDESIYSLSSLHAIEHFGLGRYGDEIDPDAWIKVLSNMCRVLAPGGRMYISVPVGNSSYLCFDAHRVYSFNLIPKYVTENVRLIECGYIYNNEYYCYTSPKGVELPDNYLCGIYIFEKTK